jgi:hypothetical protein
MRHLHPSFTARQKADRLGVCWCDAFFHQLRPPAHHNIVKGAEEIRNEMHSCGDASHCDATCNFYPALLADFAFKNTSKGVNGKLLSTKADG